MADIQIYGTLPGGGNVEIETNITAQSTNAKAAGAKAVYDFVGTTANYIPSYMGIRATSNITTNTTGSWTKYRIILPNIARSNGDKFTLDSTNGAVIVGAGVTKVKATLTGTWQSSYANETSFGIDYYNHLTDTWSILQPRFGETQTIWCTGSTSVIIDVAEGDKIGAGFNTHVSGTIEINASGTGLLVEEYIGTTREYRGTSAIATSISSSSTNDEVAGAKAVYDFAQANYSTTEQRIGTWIDGKPLYKKSVNIGSLASSATSTTYSHNIANVDYIYKTEAIAYASSYSGHNSFSLPYITGSSSYVGMYVDKTTITIITSGNRSDYSCVVTLWYTKTTDSAS